MSPCFRFFGVYTQKCNAGSYHNCVVNALRNCHIVIHSVCAILLSAGLSFNWRLWCDVRGPPMKGPHMLLESFLPHYSGLGLSRCSSSHCHTDSEVGHCPLRQERMLSLRLCGGSCCSCLPCLHWPPLVFHWGAAPSPLSESAGPGHSVSPDMVSSSSGVSWPTPGQPEPLSIFRKFAKCLRK